MYASILGRLVWTFSRTSACLNASPMWAALMGLVGIVACTTGPRSPAPELASPEVVAEERLIIPPRDQETGFTSFESDEILAPANPAKGEDPTFANLPDTELWRRIAASGGTVVIGLKAPEQSRGVWRDKLLLDTAEWEEARRIVTSMPGVTFIDADTSLPVITVRLDNAEAMQRIRALPVVDYIEPSQLPTGLFQQVGCAQDPWGTLPAPFSLDEMRLPDPFPDVMPWNFRSHLVPEAWARGAAGAGVKVAVIDTGVFEHQAQLRHPTFSSPSALGVSRDIWHHFTHGSDAWDGCGHGTRMAGTVAAPHDGANIVGVAWMSDLVVIKALPGVWVTTFNVNEVAEAIRSAAQAHEARIVVMAFGDAFASSRIADEIRLQYATRNVLFIAAAGTYACPLDFVAFPARMEEVVAVAGLTESDAVHPSSCSGPEVDLGAVIGEVPAPGKTQDEVIHFGGSSDATAIIAGVAALVWSEHPDWNRDAVRDQLYSTAGNGFRGGSKGFGRINAYKAVGGFWNLQIHGPEVVAPGEPYTLTAKTLGGGPNWAYNWSNGATGPSVSGVGRDPGDWEFWSVEVTDLRDGMMRRAAHSVSGEDPEARARCLELCDVELQICQEEEPPRVGGCGRPYDACARRCYEHF